MRLLGLTEAAVTPESVMTAYRRAAKAAHPDAGGSGDMALLQQARDTLKDTKVPTAGICPLCRGSGHVGGGMLAHVCVSCGGTGLVSY